MLPPILPRPTMPICISFFLARFRFNACHSVPPAVGGEESLLTCYAACACHAFRCAASDNLKPNPVILSLPLARTSRDDRDLLALYGLFGPYTQVPREKAYWLRSRLKHPGRSFGQQTTSG